MSAEHSSSSSPLPTSGSTTAAVATAPEAPPPTPRRRWYRLHFSSLLLLVLCLVIAAIIEVPGDDVCDVALDKPQSNKSGAWMWLKQGWPLVYAHRDPAWPPEPAATEFAAVWNPFDSIRDFNAWAFMLDFSMVLAATIVVVVVFERRRRRSHRPQFRLRTLLICTAVLAAVLGWWNYERSRSKECLRHIEALFDAPPNDDGIAMWSGSRVPVSRLPFWICSLVGKDDALIFGFNAPAVMNAHWYPEVHEQIKYLVQNYPSRVELSLQHNPTTDDWAKLAELTELEVLTVWRGDDDVLRHLAPYKNLRRLSIAWSASNSYLQISDESLLRIAEFNRLESLNLSKAKVSARNLKQLSKLPHLNSLYLDVMGLDEDVFAALTGIHSLTYLHLVPTGDLTDEIEALRRAMPKCKLEVSAPPID